VFFWGSGRQFAWRNQNRSGPCRLRRQRRNRGYTQLNLNE
jgi:hypothetical protein